MGVGGLFRLGTFAGNFRLVTSVWDRSLGNFRLGSFAWELSIGHFRSGKSPFSLNNAIFVCTCLLVLVVVLVNYGGGTRRKLFGERCNIVILSRRRQPLDCKISDTGFQNLSHAPAALQLDRRVR